MGVTANQNKTKRKITIVTESGVIFDTIQEWLTVKKR